MTQLEPTRAARQAVPKTMRAAVARRFGAPEVVELRVVPTPVPAPGEVLVRLSASTVSIADHRIRAADLPRGLGFLRIVALGAFRPRKPALGMEGAGVVAAVGDDVTGFAVGDEVVFLRGSRMGCHAEYVTMRATDAVARAPHGLSLEDAAALLFGGYTAISFLDQVELGPGTEVLVNGASGAVGTSAVQLAVHAGARVTAVTSGRNADLVRSLGAARVIDYEKEDFAAGEQRWDVIVECVGNAPFTRVERVLNPGGALLLVIADGPAMLREKGQSRRSGRLVTHTGVTFGAAVIQRLVALAEAGAVRPVVDRTFALDDIVAAHRYVDTGRKRGAVVVRIP
ncbi:NAD(P)-dependent alcohol dehydrogenase [Microbacterium sp. CFBP9034]|uniref:NAD(P)-dependent alcohol dehydrogenase n=1 Tax=Microbacterium sp. CFBP9034 TaxID=3096540 RepID=UPI002A69A48E|nr:NAD(P)-dependent alcohol dehydrogenase [Microbacterium sp. CFBP9034]MDY0910964.1 NAD(P)-dependent alcohol dehydrogenase [Microbacterium sp. CFBP9034]